MGKIQIERQESLRVKWCKAPRLCCTLAPRRGPFGRSLPLCELALGGPVLMVVVVVVGMVVLVGGFWLSGKGSSMLSIVQEC